MLCTDDDWRPRLSRDHRQCVGPETAAEEIDSEKITMQVLSTVPVDAVQLLGETARRARGFHGA